MWMKFETAGPAKFRKPVMVVALSTSIPQYKPLYSQGRELAKYMMKGMKFEEVGAMHSSSFPPEVIVRGDGSIALPACRVYLNRGRKRDILLLAGDSSPMEDQYQFTHAVLAYAKRAGVKELYSVGVRWTENPVPEHEEPEVKGFATDAAGVKALKDKGVKPIEGEPAPFFASMVVGLAKGHGMRGYKVSVDHGEPTPHPRGVAKMLEVLSSMIGFEIGLEELKSRAKPPAEKPPSAAAIYR